MESKIIPPHLYNQIYPPSSWPDDCTPPKCGELSECTDNAHTEVEDLSSRCTNGPENMPESSLVEAVMNSE